MTGRDRALTTLLLILERANGFKDHSDETLANADFRLFDPDEGEALLTYLGTWLPHVTGDESVHQTDTRTVTEGESEGRKLLEHQLRQHWGTKPSSEDLRTSGPIVEVAGPTWDENGGMLATYGIGPDYVSNLAYAEGKPGIYTGPVDFAADVTTLPFAPASIGTIYCSALPSQVEEMEAGFWQLNQDALREITAALKPGGYLIWEHNLPENYQQLIDAGFRPVYLATRARMEESGGDYLDARFALSGVYQKLPDEAQPPVDVKHR